MDNLHLYNDEKQEIFNVDFTRENFAGTGIRTRDLPTHVFFIADVGRKKVPFVGRSSLTLGKSVNIFPKHPSGVKWSSGRHLEFFSIQKTSAEFNAGDSGIFCRRELEGTFWDIKTRNKKGRSSYRWREYASLTKPLS